MSRPTEQSLVGIRIAIDECVCGLVIKQRQTIASGDVKTEFGSLYKAMLGKSRKQSMKSEVAVPIWSPTREPLVTGVLNIESPKHNAFTQDTVNIVEQFALQAGVAIHNARLHAGLKLTIDLADRLQSHPKNPEGALRSTLQDLAQFFHEGAIVQFRDTSRLWRAAAD